jgi:hypothetical protein
MKIRARAAKHAEKRGELSYSGLGGTGASVAGGASVLADFLSAFSAFFFFFSNSRCRFSYW